MEKGFAEGAAAADDAYHRLVSHRHEEIQPLQQIADSRRALA